MKNQYFIFLISFLLLSCNESKRERKLSSEENYQIFEPSLTPSPQRLIPDTIIDADYTFEEAVKDSNAPENIISQLELINVFYLSTDEKIHKGQIITNQLIANNIKEMFNFMLEERFVIEKAIPIVRYGWDDSLSMANNNSYSFCYRNISYSKHAKGLAIDINPRFNPLRWKNSDKPNQPLGAVSDTTVNGTFFPNHPVVNEFKRLGFRWGHTFTKYYDDHHFEKR